MVEMLGVLAVVGGLSAGGIAGYTYAMDRHRTNEVLNEASKRAVVVASQIASGRTPSLAEFGTGETAGGKIESDVVELEGEFGFKVTGVKESVCENIVKMVDESSGFIQDLTKANDVNSVFTLSDCSGDENSFIFIFNSDVGNGESGASVSRCAESEKVSVTYTGGRCCNETKTGKFCPGDEPATCVRDAGCDCSDSSCCNGIGGSWAINDYEEISICCSEGTALCSAYGSCICVPDGYSYDCGNENCRACSPEDGTALCPDDYAGSCICVSSGYSSACDDWACIACSPTEGTATCDGDGACTCS